MMKVKIKTIKVYWKNYFRKFKKICKSIFKISISKNKKRTL